MCLAFFRPLCGINKCLPHGNPTKRCGPINRTFLQSSHCNETPYLKITWRLVLISNRNIEHLNAYLALNSLKRFKHHHLHPSMPSSLKANTIGGAWPFLWTQKQQKHPPMHFPSQAPYGPASINVNAICAWVDCCKTDSPQFTNHVTADWPYWQIKRRMIIILSSWWQVSLLENHSPLLHGYFENNFISRRLSQLFPKEMQRTSWVKTGERQCVLDFLPTLRCSAHKQVFAAWKPYEKMWAYKLKISTKFKLQWNSLSFNMAVGFYIKQKHWKSCHKCPLQK